MDTLPETNTKQTITITHHPKVVVGRVDTFNLTIESSKAVAEKGEASGSGFIAVLASQSFPVVRYPRKNV